MLEVKRIIDEIAATSSRNEKEKILSDNSHNQLLRDVLYFIYNPFIVTGLSTKKIKKKVSIRGFSIIDSLMEYLKENDTGSDLDIASVQHYIRQQPEELQELYTQMATKNLKIGITGNTINKCWGKGFIPLFDVMLANKYEDHEHKVDKFMVSLKLDGIRAVFIKENSKIKAFTRQGQPIEGLVDLENDFRSMSDNMVYDGELLVENKAGLNSADLYRATTKVVRKDGIKKNVEFHVFDILPLSEFQEGVSKLGCYDRKMLLKEMLKESKPIWIKYVPILYSGDNKDVIYKLLDEVEKEGLEGIMVNSFDGKYECKRSSGLLKCKTFKTADVRVLNILEGTNKNAGKLGAITIQFEHEGELHECNCGSGFSDEERTLYYREPELLLGRIVEVGYFEISKNQQGGVGLRFPSWKSIIRHDKDEISMY